MTLHDEFTCLRKQKDDRVETLLRELFIKCCEQNVEEFVRRVSAQQFPWGTVYYLDGIETFRVEWHFYGLQIGYRFKFRGVEPYDIPAHS